MRAQLHAHAEALEAEVEVGARGALDAHHAADVLLWKRIIIEWVRRGGGLMGGAALVQVGARGALDAHRAADALQ